MSTRKFVIIEAPFSQDPVAMADYLRECIKDTLKRGESAINSVATYALTGALDVNPEERRAGIEAGLAWYSFSSSYNSITCVVYTDHGISEGMQEGIARASEHQIKIVFRKLVDFENQLQANLGGTGLEPKRG